MAAISTPRRLEYAVRKISLKSGLFGTGVRLGHHRSEL
jgi:hypothetical protein